MAHNHKATKTTSAQIQSPTARSKLAAQTRPYFVKVADGAWIGYRKPLTGPGSWVARVGAGDGKGWEKTLWQADDGGLKPDGAKVLSFWQAKTEVQKLAGWTNDAAENTAPVIITLDEALKGYGSALRNRGADAYNARQPRPHLSAVMLSKPLTLLTKDELEKWRDGLLEKGLAPATVNRMMTRLRAALTHADKSRTHIWRDGLQALPDATEADNVVIEDEATAQAWVAEAYALDHQLGLLTHTLAETGARPSQATRLRIRDLVTVDMNTPRLLMPKSAKGGTKDPTKRKAERYPVAISPELARLLKTAAAGRPSNALLLLRKNGQAWETDVNKSNHYYGADVRRIVSKIGLDPDTFGMYAFRHTSITRMLLRGTHTAIVAKVHDTSEAMIRKHYASSILDFSDAITRQTLPSLGPAAPAASNVVPLAKGRLT